MECKYTEGLSTAFYIYIYIHTHTHLCANTVFVYYNVKFICHEFVYPCYAIPMEIKQVIKQMSLNSITGGSNYLG